MDTKKRIPLIGVASDIAGNIPGTAKAPAYLQQHLAISQQVAWLHQISQQPDPSASVPQVLAKTIKQLSTLCADTVAQSCPFVTFGGDHSIAMGTWSGAANALAKQQKTLGLIWVDAHLDAHTMDSSHTKNIHGMPAAALMGHASSLIDYFQLPTVSIQPQHLFYLGIRSFEPEEKALVESLGCHVFTMNDIHQLGMKKIIEIIKQRIEASAIDCIGMTIDLDALDPSEASAVTVPEDDGLLLSQVLELIQSLSSMDWVGAEFVEYCPDRDNDARQSLHCIQAMFDAVLQPLLKQRGVHA